MAADAAETGGGDRGERHDRAPAPLWDAAGCIGPKAFEELMLHQVRLPPAAPVTALSVAVCGSALHDDGGEVAGALW